MPKENRDQEQHPESCACADSKVLAQGATTCGGSITIPTLEEQHILAQIRQLQEEAQRIKEAIRQLESLPNPPGPHLTDLHEQLRLLRQRRIDLEDERVRAAHERMRLLGHA